MSTASYGAQLLAEYRDRLCAICDDDFPAAYEAFLRNLAPVENALDGLDQAERKAFSEFYSGCQKKYLAVKERAATLGILAAARDRKLSTTESKLSTESMCGGFDRDAYDRVRDLRLLVDFSSCRKVVMVGSGVFPATLLWLHDHFPDMDYLGLDRDGECVELAARLAEALGFDRISFACAEASDFNFDGADFVYVANHVVPKRAVLLQIGRSASVKQVVVREPTPCGELLAEAVRHALPSSFSAQAAGSRSSTFLSYDLLLTRE